MKKMFNNRGGLFGAPNMNPEYGAYQVDASAEDGTVYIRYANDNICAITRISTADGVTTIEWAYGAWADRASLTYVPINEAIVVED